MPSPGRELSASVDASGRLLRRNGEHRKGARAHAFGIHRPRHAIVARGATPGLRVSSGNGQVYAADHVPFMRCSWRCISERVCLCFGSAARLYSSCGSAASSYSFRAALAVVPLRVAPLLGAHAVSHEPVVVSAAPDLRQRRMVPRGMASGLETRSGNGRRHATVITPSRGTASQPGTTRVNPPQHHRPTAGENGLCSKGWACGSFSRGASERP